MTRARLPLPEPDGELPRYVIGWFVPAWREESMHAYASAENAALRAELFGTNERWEKSHQIALAIQDERDALREQVRGLREVLEGVVRASQRGGFASDIARAALGATK